MRRKEPKKRLQNKKKDEGNQNKIVKKDKTQKQRFKLNKSY